MSGASVVESQRVLSPVVDDVALVQHGVVDVVELVARHRLHVAREDRAAMRVDRRQHELGQVARYTSAHGTVHTHARINRCSRSPAVTV